MDIYSSATAWLQQQQQQAQQQVQQSDSQSVQRLASADWKETAPGTNGAATTTPVQGSIDLSDFGLGDLSVPQASSSSLASPSNSFFNFAQNYFSVPGPYNAMGYGTTSWSNQPGQVPLSTYSTLNGATTSTAGPTQTSPQSPTGQAMIDPALTTMAPTSTSTQSYASSPSVSQSQSPQPAQHPTSQYSYSQIHPNTLSYIQSSSHFPTSQQTQLQGTLSPYALHSPTMMTGISPSSFYSNPATATAPVQSRKDAFLAALKPSLSPKNFSGARGVQQLVSPIADYGILEVDAQTRLEILTKIRDNAGNHFFRAWLENSTAMDVTREWLKAGATNTDDEQVQETIMPLLHIVDRLPFTYETLAASKVGRTIRKLGKDALIPAVKDMASNLERKWREKYVPEHERAMNVDEDPQARKRKASEPPSSKLAQPTKKAAISAASSSKPVVVKKEIKATTVKESKSDSSFFSAPKPKPKLPSFKKSPAPPAVKKELDANIAQPSAIDPFQEALKAMAKARKSSPAPAPPSSNANVASVSVTLATGLTKSGKKKKVVTWAPDGQLELVKLIEKAIYDDDPINVSFEILAFAVELDIDYVSLHVDTQGSHPMHNMRDLERGEGAALHAHLFEELIDWFEPPSVELPPDLEVRPRGEESQEKATQEQRELTALGAMYLSLQQIPDSPAEPAIQIQPEQVDENVRVMLVGPEVDMLFFSPPPTDQPMAGVSVSDLVGQLAGNSSTTLGQTSLKGLGFDPGLISQVTSMGTLPPEQLQHIAQLLAQQSAFPGSSQNGGHNEFGDGQEWNANNDFGSGGGGEYGYQQDGDGERRWNSDRPG
ncbi:hypothetical protein EW146_g6870, partial [Bondarzewia mesenterica]